MSEPEPEEVSDEEYVRRAQNGDTRAFDQLVLKYSRKLYGMVYHMTGHPDDTHDLLQDVFAKAYRSLKRFRGNSTFYTWIYTIAHNMTLNHLRKHKKRQARSLDEVDTGLENDSAMIDWRFEANPRHHTDVNELQKKLNEALQSLSNEHRAVVTMFDIQGLPHAEISKILGVSEGTVRSRLYYAHQQLQGFLQDYLR